LVELVGGTGQWRMAEILGYAVLADRWAWMCSW
jgi:hypothetical protein